MSSLRAFMSQLFSLTLAVLALFGTSAPLLHAQSLRISPPIFNVSAVNGTNSAVNLLSNPAAIAVDATGNLYVADTSNRFIRKVDPTQTASIVAGSGGFGYSGDNGPATAARFGNIVGIACDPAGNIYIADNTFNAIRKVATTGIITTFAGNNGSSSSGNGGLATSAALIPASLATDYLGNVFVIDTASQTVRVIGTDNIIRLYAGSGSLPNTLADNGPATAAQLSSPASLATDLIGNLFIGDIGTSTVRKVDTLGTITTYAGTVYGSTGNGGPATAARITAPYALATDNAGNLFIADTNAYFIRMVNPAGKISTIAGYGQSNLVFDGLPADQARIAAPRGLAADINGNLFILVTQSNAVYRVPLHPERFPPTRVGNTSLPQRLILENYGPNTVKLNGYTFGSDFLDATLVLPNSRPCNLSANVFSGFGGYCTIDVSFRPTAEGIRAFPLTVSSNDTPGTLIQTLTSTGLGSALALTSGQMFVIAGNRGVPLNPTAIGSATSVPLNNPSGIAVDSAGNVFFSEPVYCHIRRIDAVTGFESIIAGTDPLNCDGPSTYVAGDGGPATLAILNGVTALAFDAGGNLFLGDNRDGRIRMIDPAGIIHPIAGTGIGSGTNAGGGYSGDGGPALVAQLSAPLGLAFDKLGNLYIADTLNNVIRKINTAGIISTVAGNYALGAGYSGDGGPATAARLNYPTGVTVDSAGNIYIADYLNDVIRKVLVSNGSIVTIAGKAGVQDYTGDGGPASKALLFLPYGLSVDAADDIFFTDRSNHVVRKIDPSGIISTIAGARNGIDGNNAFNGTNLPATSSNLQYPDAVTVSSSGFIFITDTRNQVVREMSPNGALVFPPQQVGTTSAPQTVNVSNIGNMPLHFDSLFATGITGDFATVGGNCDFTAPLATGASCNVNITFTPTVEGVRHGVFGFFDDGVASPQYVSLAGTGRQSHPQVIIFPSIPTKKYGNTPFDLSATASSGLPVTYTVISGNASITLSGSTVFITGKGTVVIAANQAGDANWNAAPQVNQVINIDPATLFLVANNAFSFNGQPLNPLTYNIVGYQYNDTPANAYTGAAALTTTATPNSTPGNYPIVPSLGTLHAANYVFDFTNGIYTISKNPTPVQVVPTIILTTTVIFARLPDSGYQSIITVKNTGNSPAPNVFITGVKIGSSIGNPVSAALGTIPAGGSATRIFGFNATIGVPGTMVLQQTTGTYTGGTFGGTVHITLP